MQFIITVQSDYPGQQGPLVVDTHLTKYICSAVTTRRVISVKTFLSTSSSPLISVPQQLFSGQQFLFLPPHQSVGAAEQLSDLPTLAQSFVSRSGLGRVDIVPLSPSPEHSQAPPMTQLSTRAQRASAHLKTQDLVALVDCVVVLFEPKFDSGYVEDAGDFHCSHPVKIM